MRSLLLTLAILCCLRAGGATDFSKMSNWFGANFTANKQVDVLYFAPTSVNENSNDRAVMDGWMVQARALFGESCDFYAPYYRQVPIEAWGTPSFAAHYAVALTDAQAAFDYYMEHHNHGRPFILAGYSQGALLVYSLLRSRITSDNYPLMVAAYTIGYSITQAEVQASPYIVPARGSTDVGVCISFNSVATGAKPMFPKNHININPVNWSTDTLTATTKLKSTDVTLSVQCDSVGKYLRVSGINPQAYHRPYLGADRFAQGNYHLYEFDLYFPSLQQNVEDRVRSYMYKRAQVEN